MKLILRTYFIFCTYLSLNAQVDPLSSFNFDNCLITDEMGVFQDGEIHNNLLCDCGVGESSNAFYFNGTADTIVMDPNLKSVFDNDFSLSFYLWLDDASTVYPIMSIQESCAAARDSAFFIRYFPSSKELILELTKNFGELVSLRVEIDNLQCWNHLLFTKEDRLFSLYLNGEFIESKDFFNQVPLGLDHPFFIGMSPCVGISDVPFRGRIDELKFFNYSIKEEDEIESLNEYADLVISMDTTIFEGSTISLVTGPTCSNNISWSPSSGLDNPFSPFPMASPTETTNYTVSFDHGTCVSQDEILVSVLSEADIDCQEILLPNAFTPNEDGLNDRYGISNHFILEDLLRFEIFDRWGLKVFETNNKLSLWDGTYKNSKMPPGTYVYKIEYQCMDQDYKKIR